MGWVQFPGNNGGAGGAWTPRAVNRYDQAMIPELVFVVVVVALAAVLSLPISLPGIDALLGGDPDAEGPDAP